MMRELAALLRGLKDPRIGDDIVSVTHVEVTSDMKHAKVFVSVLGDEARMKNLLSGLKSAGGYLRRELSKNMQLRHTPELLFMPDNSITEGANIMKILEKL